MDRRRVAEYRLDDSPRRFHFVLAHEEHRIALQGVANQTLIRRHLAGLHVAREQLDVLSVIASPGAFTRAPIEMMTSGLRRNLT